LHVEAQRGVALGGLEGAEIIEEGRHGGYACIIRAKERRDQRSMMHSDKRDRAKLLGMFVLGEDIL
jgi:hypothetical protein